MSRFVTGQQKMANNLIMLRHRVAKLAGEAVEKTCVDVANHAKANHASATAHAARRYRNRTGNLTGSITPELKEVTLEKVHGIVHTSGLKYGYYVEFGTKRNWMTMKPNKPYPFLQPALNANQENLRRRLSLIVK